MDIVPIDKDKRKLRACLLCSLIKSQAQFRKDGCNNCDEVLGLKGSMDRILDCTSANFEGVISVMKPELSWVSRWQRVDKFSKGLYAMRISGRLPVEIEEELLDKGIKYRPRDGSVRD